MSDPVPVLCPKGVYTKVVTAAQAGLLYIQEFDPQLDTAFFAFNDTGDGDPPLEPQVLNSTAVQIEDRTLGIKFSDPKDIYIWTLDNNVSVLPSISTP